VAVGRPLLDGRRDLRFGLLQVLGPGISLWMTLVLPFSVLIVGIRPQVTRPESPISGDEQPVGP
jgi:hypothetical protein